MNPNDDPISRFDDMVELRSLQSAPRRTNTTAVNLEGGTIPLLQQESESPNLIAQPRRVTDEEEPGLLRKIYDYFTHGPVSTADRIIIFDRNVYPPNKLENTVRNQKYTVSSFIPLVLFNQFKSFFNLFFLMIAFSQFIDDLKVGSLFVYMAPLAFVIIVTMIKEGLDDYNRYKHDEEINAQIYKVFADTSVSIYQTNSALKVGDIIEINANQRVPADLLLLYTSEDSGTALVKTDQLDGATNWKSRKSVKHTQRIIERGGSLFGLPAKVTAEPPRGHLYDFIGTIETEAQNTKHLSLENTLWTDTVLKSGKAYGMVLYTGKETRMALNTRGPRSKTGNLDRELNKIMKYLFVFVVVMSFVIIVFRDFGLIQYLKYVLLLSSIIPISLRVNLDLTKAIFSYRIENDQDIQGTIVKNSTIPEELGRVEFLLVDKTGTLTQNEMVWKKMCLEGIQYDESNLGEMKQILRGQCQGNVGPANNSERRRLEEERLGPLNPGRRNRLRRAKPGVFRDLITALCVCNSVTPIIEEEGKMVYQGESPDEIALVEMAESVTMRLMSRGERNIRIENAAGRQENYEILANFPFTSERRRMGMIVQHKETKRIIFYLKGADSVMGRKIPEHQRGFVLDEVEELAKTGLRTLVISQKYLTQREYEDWNAQYQSANNEAENRVIESLENDMEFLGITGVEDKLQEEVSSTIESLRDAGVCVWMLTGDSIETAFSIALSAGFKSNRQGYHLMKEIEDPLEIENQLAQFNNKARNTVLFIDGATLIQVFENHRKYFFDVACKAPAVIFCRVSPAQKALIAEAIKELQQKTVCCVGDGANDVSMIRSADIGIGIIGKEGKQAALAADYSIPEFRYLKTLLLWHGRNSYKRTAVMAEFVIHRGLTIAIIQALFSIVFSSVAIPVYNGYLMLGYITIYTILPVLWLILDFEVSKKVALVYAPLYKTLREGRDLNKRAFLTWVLESIYQGGVIMLFSSHLNIVTITFSALIVTEFLNVYSGTYKKNIILWICFCCRFSTYALSIIFLKNYFDVSTVTDLAFIFKVISITLVSWVPLRTVRFLSERWNPSEDTKVMRRARVMQRREEEEWAMRMNALAAQRPRASRPVTFNLQR